MKIIIILLFNHPFPFGSYETAGELYIDFADTGEVTDYSRTLDISRGSCLTEYKQNGQRHTREIFASLEQNVIAMRITSEGGTSFKLTYDRRLTGQHFTGNGCTISGAYESIVWFSAVRIVTDGNVTFDEASLEVADAHTCDIYISIDTDYRGLCSDRLNMYAM